MKNPATKGERIARSFPITEKIAGIEENSSLNTMIAATNMKADIQTDSFLCFLFFFIIYPRKTDVIHLIL